jgi:hypothetical protein
VSHFPQHETKLKSLTSTGEGLVFKKKTPPTATPARSSFPLLTNKTKITPTTKPTTTTTHQQQSNSLF